jgi:ATP-dependent DNA ligase
MDASAINLIYDHACKFGLEGIVSKRRDLPYQSGKLKRWLKIKNDFDYGDRISIA